MPYRSQIEPLLGQTLLLIPTVRRTPTPTMTAAHPAFLGLNGDLGTARSRVAMRLLDRLRLRKGAGPVNPSPPPCCPLPFYAMSTSVERPRNVHFLLTSFQK